MGQPGMHWIKKQERNGAIHFVLFCLYLFARIYNVYFALVYCSLRKHTTYDGGRYALKWNFTVGKVIFLAKLWAELGQDFSENDKMTGAGMRWTYTLFPAPYVNIYSPLALL